MGERWPDPPTRTGHSRSKIVLMDDGDFGDTTDDAPRSEP
jgi:hypothetical protein